MFSLITSAEQGVNEFVSDRHLVAFGTHVIAQRIQMEDAISSTRQLLSGFGLRLSHLTRTFDAFRYSMAEL